MVAALTGLTNEPVNVHGTAIKMAFQQHGIWHPERRFWQSLDEHQQRYQLFQYSAKESFRNFTTEDGLPGNEFVRGQFLKSRSRQNVFRRRKRHCLVQSNRFIKISTSSQQHFITGLYLFNKPVDYKTDSSVINKPIQYTQSITLPYEKT